MELFNIMCANHLGTRRSILKKALCFGNFDYDSKAVRRLCEWGMGRVAGLKMGDEDSSRKSERRTGERGK